MTPKDLLEKKKSGKNGFLLAVLSLAGVFFTVLSPSVPNWEIILGRHSFITSDAMLFLGLSLLAAALGFFLSGFFKTHPLEGEFPKGLFMLFSFAAVPAAAFVLYGVNQAVLHGFMSSADEHSCYFLAECLRKGKLWVPPHALSEFFNVTHIGNKAGKWFSVYPPGWPLIWSFGISAGLTHWVNPVLTALSLPLFLASARRIFDRSAAVLGLLLALTAPFFLFTGAAYFSHPAALLMSSLFLYSFLRWNEAGNDQKTGWAMLCAAAIGYGLMTRYLTTAALALPFLIPPLTTIIKRRRLTRDEMAAAAVLLIFFILILWQNFTISGKPFKAPNQFDKSWERLGFRSDYTPLDGFWFIAARIFYLMDWTAPALVIFYFLSFFSGFKLTPLQKSFRLAPVSLALAYFLYFSWGGNQWGPRYYYEAFPFLTVTAAVTLLGLWKKWPEWRGSLFAVLLVSFFAQGFLFQKQAAFHGKAAAERKALYALAEKNLQTPSIVFVHGFLGDTLVMGEEDAVRNSPFLDGRILYAHDLGAEKNTALMKAMPGRLYFRGYYDRSRKSPVLELLEGSPS